MEGRGGGGTGVVRGENSLTHHEGTVVAFENGKQKHCILLYILYLARLESKTCVAPCEIVSNSSLYTDEQVLIQRWLSFETITTEVRLSTYIIIHVCEMLKT